MVDLFTTARNRWAKQPSKWGMSKKEEDYDVTAWPYVTTRRTEDVKYKLSYDKSLLDTPSE